MRSAIKTWIVKVPLVIISEQLGISEASLRRILAFAKAHPLNPIRPRKPGSGKHCKIIKDTKKGDEEACEQEANHHGQKDQEDHPSPGQCHFHQTQKLFQKSCSCPQRRWLKCPFTTLRMKDHGLAFAREYEHRGMYSRSGKKPRSVTRAIMSWGLGTRLARRPREQTVVPHSTWRRLWSTQRRLMAWGSFSWMERGQRSIFWPKKYITPTPFFLKMIFSPSYNKSSFNSYCAFFLNSWIYFTLLLPIFSFSFPFLPFFFYILPFLALGILYFS